jgi:thiamine-phosphate pyrophosphorylase
LKKTDRLILCYVTERRSLRVENGPNRETALVQRIETTARAGVDWIQIREKDLPARGLVDLTHAAIRVCKSVSARSETRVVVNDRFDVAWAAGAAGIHAGETSLPIRVLVDARQAARLKDFLIGASCHSLNGAINAAEAGADYVFFGPVFETPSKAAFGSPQGTAKLAQVCNAVSIPVIAIGGITLENARVCRDSGAAGIAAIRLFQDTGDIGEIVAALATK